MAGAPGKTHEKKACYWYTSAALAGDADAQLSLALHCLRGVGTELDARAGLDWLEKAAAQNQPQALYELSLLYLGGRGVEENPEKAVKLLLKSAETGYREAVEVLKNIGMADR